MLLGRTLMSHSMPSVSRITRKSVARVEKKLNKVAEHSPQFGPKRDLALSVFEKWRKEKKLVLPATKLHDIEKNRERVLLSMIAHKRGSSLPHLPAHLWMIVLDNMCGIFN